MAALAGLIQETLGIGFDKRDEGSQFISLGADSLSLMQLGRGVQGRFGLAVTFRQLVAEYATPKLLADAIRATHESVPARSGAAPSRQPIAEPAITPQAKGGSGKSVDGAIAGKRSLAKGEARSARLGHDDRGRLSWFLPNPRVAGGYLKIESIAIEQGIPSYGTSEVAYDPYSPITAQELPSTPSQSGMWQSSLPGRTGVEASCAENESFSVRLKGSIDDQAILQALRALADLHPALRGHFSSDGRVFRIESSIAIPISNQDISGLAPEHRERALRQICEEEARTCYSLAKGPLYRATVIHMDSDERIVLLGTHRSACDGWSLDVILLDFSRLYSAFADGAPLPQVAQYSYADYIEYRKSDAYLAKVRQAETTGVRHSSRRRRRWSCLRARDDRASACTERSIHLDAFRRKSSPRFERSRRPMASACSQSCYPRSHPSSIVEAGPRISRSTSR